MKVLDQRKPEKDLLLCRHLPAVLHVEGAAALLGLSIDQVSRLTAAGLFPVLGHPKANAAKCYATKRLLALAEDEKFLSKCIDFLYSYHRRRNQQYARVRAEASDAAARDAKTRINIERTLCNPSD